MARKTNEQQARELAAELRVELTVDGGEYLEVWSGGGSHLSEYGGVHTMILSREMERSWPAMWRAAYVFMRDNLRPCEADCTCR